MQVRRLLIAGISFLVATTIVAQPAGMNRALHLDGNDNNVRTGMGIIKAPWTLEAWIKGNDVSWKQQEVIFGGGEYSTLSTTDDQPLVIRNGRLHNAKAGLWSPQVLDDQWHHVAISCDGSVTRLYLDGVVTASKQVAFSVLPGALGIQEDSSTVFGGLMDEVRIWHTALAAPLIRNWMGRPLNPRHPGFKSLAGYYTFDDGIDDAAVNWVGKGDQAYHLRNGRVRYKGNARLAYTVENDNPKFVPSSGSQALFNAVVVNSEWDADQGTPDDPVLKLRIAVTGTSQPLWLRELALDLSGVTALSDITRVHVYYTGKTARSKSRKELFGSGSIPGRKMILSNPGKPLMLSPGINYFLVTADIAEKAVPGNKISITVPAFATNKQHHKPETGPVRIDKSITVNSGNHPDIVRVLQWNIWHGGVHLGDNGLNQVIDLIKATNADVVTMQEAYGSQQRIGDALGYHLRTASARDNLALFSRYPVTPISTGYHAFNSNPVKIVLPGGRPLILNACWLRYAYRPEYTSTYQEPGQDVGRWIAEDSALGLADIRGIIEKDTKPYEEDGAIPVIMGGDFNSCSHYDWTKAAAPLHFSYGPVAFPISRYMLAEGYKDSFRELNPDEVLRPEGTWAVIYGHLQHCRIDFLYYKGPGIKAVASKIIKTAPEIDDVWASDHAAVLTTFKLEGAQ